MAKFMESASSIKNSVKKKKEDESAKKKTTKAASSKPKTQSSVSSKKAQTQKTVNRLSNKYAGGSTRNTSKPKATTTKPKATTTTTTAPKRATTTTSRNPRMQDAVVQSKPAQTTRRDTTPVSSQKSRQVQQNLQQKYGENKVNNTVKRRDTTPVKSAADKAFEEQRDKVSVSRNPRMQDTARNTKVQSNAERQESLNTAKRAIRNTPTVAKESAKQVLQGHGKTAADVTAANKSAAIGSRIDIKSPEFMRDIEKRREASTSTAKKTFKELAKAQERSEQRLNNVTKNARGLEKAYYGAVQSGTGILADIAIGGGTQAGSLAAMGSRVYGNTRGTAQREGATENEDRLYSFMQAAKEVGTELVFPGVGLAGKAYGKKAALPLAERIANRATRNLTGKAADVAGAGIKLLGGTAEENLEEFAGWGLDPLIKEYTYGKNVRVRGTKALMQQESNALRSNIRTREDADRAASYLNSQDFLDENVRQYMDAGLSQEQAQKAALQMRDYLTASLTGNTQEMQRLESDIMKTVSNKKWTLADWDRNELADTLMSTTLLTGVTGLPGAVTTSRIGNNVFNDPDVRKFFGDDAQKVVANEVINSSDETNSLRAQAMRDRLNSGKDLTGTQKYDLWRGYQQKTMATAEKHSASVDLAERNIEKNNYVQPVTLDENGRWNRAVRNEYEYYQLGDETQRKYEENFDSALATAETLRASVKSEEDSEAKSITETTEDRTRQAAAAVAALKDGYLTIGDVHEFGFGNTLARETLKAETGIDLNQYIVRNSDGTVNYAKTNEATENALFAIAADNMVKTAKAETETFIDHRKGEIDKDLMTRFGAEGQKAWKDINKSLDPRDTARYLASANAASYMYAAGRNTTLDQNEAVRSMGNVFRSVDNNVLVKSFEAGRQDREIAMAPAVGQTVSATDSMAGTDTVSIPTGSLTMDEDMPRSIPDSEQQIYKALAEATGVNIHLASHLDLKDDEGNVVGQANGSSYGDTIILNANSAAEQNLGYVFMHEMTHQIKKYAPAEYTKLENLIRDAWFEKDYAGMQREIKHKIDLYGNRAGQTLSEDMAMEEIVADAMAEAIDDPRFARAVCTEDVGMGKAILNSIRNALRSLRDMIANTVFRQNNNFHKNLLSYLDVLSEAESLWIRALNEATKARAAQAVDALQNQIYAEDEQAKHSISPTLDKDLQDVIDNKFNSANGEVLIGNTSDFMVNIMEAKPHLVTMPANKAYRAMVTEEEAKRAGRYRPLRSEFDNYHGLGKQGLLDVLESAEDPVIAFADKPNYESGDRRYGHIVLVTDKKDAYGDYVVVVQRVDSTGRIKGKRVDVNKIITAYGKDYIKGQIQDAIAENRLLYVDKKRSHVIDGGISGRFADGHQSDFKNNIDAFWANVNYEKSQGRFSISEPVERVRDLIAVHNLKADDIRNTFELGGFPMPSIAVTKDSMGHDLYGDITLMFNSNTIDPQFNRNNQVFGGDAWTPTFPTIRYKHNEKVTDKIRDLYYDNANRIGYDAMRPLYDVAVTPEDAINIYGGEQGLKEHFMKDTSIMRTFLKMNDKDVEDVVTRTETTLSDTEQKLRQHMIDSLGEDAVREWEGADVPNGSEKAIYRRQWVENHLDEIKDAYKSFMRSGPFHFSEEEVDNVISNMKLIEFVKLMRNASNFLNDGATTVKEEVDRKATDERVKIAAQENGYGAWVNSLLDGIEEKQGIRNDKDAFTRQGNRRSWESLHEPVTLENVVKVMRSELAAGGNGIVGANPKGAAQKNYKNLDEIRSDEDRLQQLPEEEFKELEGSATQKLVDVCQDIVDSNPKRFDNKFGATLDVGEYVAEILNETKDKSSIHKRLQKDYTLKVTDEQMDDLMEAIDAIANLPTGYFEAKPRRAVGFDEVKAAIIPASTDEDIKQGFNDRGIQMYEYDPEVEGDRTAKVNEAATAQDLRFSITDSEGNELSEGQVEFFRDSKMVDAEGRLKPMYHGTQNEFYEFDITKAYPGTLGRGFYFSDSDSHAGVYGKTNKYYLNLVNPLMPGTNNITKDQLHRFVSELAEGEDYGLENYGYGATVDSVVASVWGKSDFAMLRDLNLTAVGDFAEAIKVFNRVNDTDYDGIITDTETIAFYPQQIKSVDNLNPTLSKDTRYSITDSDGKELSDGQVDFFKNSQARDSQGRLVPVYHTTKSSGFTIFDPQKADDNRSLFFTSNRKMSASYSKNEGQIPPVINPYDVTAPNRTITAVYGLPDIDDIDISLKELTRRVSNIRVTDSWGEEVASGDDFVKVAQEVGRYLESKGYDLYDDLAVDPYLLDDENDWGSKEGDAWNLYNEITNEGLHYTMDFADPVSTYAEYLNLENPLIVDADGEYWDSIPFGDDHTQLYNTRQIAEIAQNEGHDGVIIRNVVDYDGYGYGLTPSDVYVAFSSNQVKDIRNENPSENPDIRYSVPEDEVKDRVAYTDAMDNSYEALEAYEAYISEHPDDVESYVAKNFDEETVSAFNSALVDYSGRMFDDKILEDGRVRIAKSREDFFRSVNAKWRESWPTEGEVLNIDSVKGNIRKLVRGVMANADANHQYKTDVATMTLADARTAFQLMKQGRQEYAMNLLYHSAQRMVEGIQFVQDDTEFQTYKEIRAFMRNSKVSIDEEYWNDVDYQKFRRENMSRMKLIRGKQNVEDVYADLQDNWPWIFNEEERAKVGLGNDVPALLLHIGHVLDQNLTPFMAAYSSEDATALCFDIADQLYDIIEAGRPIKSLADSMNKRDAKKLDKLYDQMEENAANAEREYNKSIEDLKEQFDQQTKAMKVRHDEAVRKVKANMAEMEEAKNAEIDKLKAEANDSYLLQKRAIAKEREAKWQAIEEEKAKRAKETERANMWRGRYRERIQKDVQDRKDKAERKGHKKQFTKVQNNYDWLVKRLLSPTKDKNIPEQLRVPLAKLLMQFDLQTENSKKLEEKYGPAKKTLQMRELKDKIAAVSKEDESGELPYSTWLVGSMEQLSDALDDKPIDSLSTGDIALINEVLSTIIHGINNHQKIRINGKKVEIASYGDKTISNLHERIGKFGQRKDFIGTIGLFDRLVNEGEETPIYFFSRLDPASDGIGAMYRELRKGEDKHIRNMNYLRNRFRDITGEFFNEKGPGSKLEEWRSMRKAQTFDLSGGPITLTPAQMMSLVCLADREDALEHLLVGGIVATPVSFGAKMTDKLKPVSVKTSSTHITKADIQMIKSKLTPDQMKVAKKLQQLMAKEMADWGNETSMDMYGIKMFKDPNYFPMRSSQMELPTDPNNAANDKTEKIRNFGFTKPITPNANNAIYIDDIFSVVADHCNKMSLYNSMAIPIMDFMKVYNYKQRNDDGSTVTVKETIGDAFTKKANSYIEKFLADVNGNTQTKSDAVDALFNKSLANYKKASIGANMRVALQQPTAIVRALQVLDPKWFVGIRPSAKATREMFEHCPIALWKSWGHYDMDMGRDMEDIMMNNDWSKWDTATMGVYGRLDDMTWGMIWQAVKKEVKAKNPKVDVNSEVFYELCNERASEVFDKTQVVDSIFHRSDTMRSKNTLTKMATSFMAEPTLTYNVFRNALVTGNEMWKTGDRKGAVKTWNRMAIVLMMNAAAVSAAAAIWDAVRGKGGDDDDDKGKVDLWWENFMANFMDNAPWAQWNNIYFVKDVISLKDGWGTSNMALEGFATFFKGVGQLKKKVTEGSDKSWYEVAMNTAGGLGYIFGVPAKTMLRDAKAIFDFFGIEVSAMDSLSDTSKNEPVIKIGGLTDKVSKMLLFGKDSKSDSKKSDASTGSGSEGSWDDVYKELEAEEQQLAKLEEKAAKKAASAPAGQRDEVLWDTLTDGYTSKLKEGHMDYIDQLRDIYVRNGGREEVFDSKLLDGIKRSYKSTINAENTADQMEGQYDMQQYMLNHGVTAEEISDMCYHSYTAKDLKAAMRLGNEEYMIDELVPLIQAGFSEEDFNKCWKQRYNYRNYTGKYTDPKYRISTGTYAWPITGTITSRFGGRKSPGGIGSTNHMGLDIAGSMGDPVHAADGGEVIYADWWYGGGNVVRIRHENGEVTEYMHLSGYNCKVGDHVGKGDQIGQVGSTGNSTGPHLHFGVMDKDGNHLDPEVILAQSNKG